MPHRPNCDLCGVGTMAHYDAKTVHGSWGFLCRDCHGRYGVGLGTGRGQEIVDE